VNSFPVVSSSQYRRLAALTALLIAAFAGLGYRLVDLQVTQHDRLADLVSSERQRTLVRPPRRGAIYDARRNVLATSLFVKTVFADPSQMGTNQAAIARLLAPLLRLDESRLVELMQPRAWVDAQGERKELRYAVLKKKVPLEEWQEIRKVMQGLSLGVDESKLTRSELRKYLTEKRRVGNSIGADPVDDQVRVYPNGPLAAHVLGFTGVSDSTNRNPWSSDLVGKDGLELRLDGILIGAGGWQRILQDVRGAELVAHRDQDVAPRAGLNVVLTLDAGLQAIVESELAEAWAKHTPNSLSAVMVRPTTGEILALASLPNFDPNAPGDATADSRRNRVICDLAEPGSTFKIVVVSGALNEGVVSLEDVFDCENGRFQFRGQTLGDHHPNGALTVENIIAKSSNIGAAKVGIRLGESLLYHYMRSFGFGDRTGIPLPGEVRGIVHPTNRWSKISVAWIPMGHEVAVTPLQMVMAMSALANGGRLLRPILVDHVEDEQGRLIGGRAQPVVVRQILGEATAQKMVRALKTAVLTGTGKQAQLDYYPVAGKTGTAQKIKDGVYSHSAYFASFIGFFPADDPKVCLAVVMDEPKKGSYGGETAAPVFQKIATRAAGYLGIPPILPPLEARSSGAEPSTGKVAAAPLTSPPARRTL
jgi:cell division protein FtsI/penicillin-binding protein 2